MFLAHSFRLRDPWQCEPTADGGLRWSRVFHRPTGLEPDDQLVLVLTGLPPSADIDISVNGRRFPPQASSLKPQASSYDLTAILADDNRIELLIPPQASNLKPQASTSFPYDARLAIIGHS